jgi:hypothetical protein
MGTIDAIDREALERCLAAARAENPARAKQIDLMLADQPWEEVAVFAATCAQSRSLDLPPWQSPPFRASLRDLEKPYGDASGKRESAELLKRLRDANLSIFEPDPMRALAEAEQRQPVMIQSLTQEKLVGRPP